MLLQGNPMHALGESVSFGRFMSESLAWEKWSTFSHNRYVEEAERYAQKGSVAQKKAFFEAHYKRIAAKKAAALLEQANAATSTTTEPEEAESGINVNSIADSLPLNLNSSQIAVSEPSLKPEVKTQDAKPEFMTALAESEKISSVKQVEPATNEVMEPEAPVETPVKIDSSNLPDNLENQEMMVSGSELSGTPQMEKPLLKVIVLCLKLKWAFSFFML